MNLLEYNLKADLLYLGEREKGGIFKPCLKTIPFSQISGALNAKFGRDDFKAVGYLSGDNNCNIVSTLTYAPRDRQSSLSKVPLQMEFLVNACGVVVIEENSASNLLPSNFEVLLGGFRSRGFGKCNLTKTQVIDGQKSKKGILNVRIPCDETESFSIKNIISPVYGYLFRPDPEKKYTGKYVLSLFEGTEIVAPPVLLKEGDHG